jgi:hypothetical protein
VGIFDDKRGDETMKISIGERICAAVLGHKLGISTDRAWKLYVRGREISPSWEAAGETLLESSMESSAPESDGPDPGKPIPPESGNVH